MLNSSCSALDPRSLARAPWRALWLLLAAGTPSAALASPDSAPSAEHAAVERLERRVEELAGQLAEVRTELARLRASSPASAAAAPAGAPPSASAPADRPPASALANLSLWGYGEAYLARPVHAPADTQADLARAVFGIGYRFDDRTSFNSEFEVEHAVASSGDVGEFEVEQFFIEHQLGGRAVLRAGLILMPFGLLNEHHEPTNFYGVERNFVETLIIPSTWREGGAQLNLRGESGLALSTGVTTGFDLSKWEFAPEFPPYHTALGLQNSGSAPLQATHQELALANASHPSGHVALSYTGVPGLALGGAAFYGDAVAVPGTSGTPRVALWEGHARWTPAGFDLSALYARGSISHTFDANLANAGSPNPIPASFDGYYLQAAYAAGVALGSYRLAPFARYEYFNLGASYEGAAPAIPAGLVPLSSTPGAVGLWPVGYDRVVTLGASLYLNPNVVVKLDYQNFDVNRDFSRIDLGLGLSF